MDDVTYDDSGNPISTTANTNSQLSVVAYGTNENFNIYIETTASFPLTTYYLRASTQSTYDTVANNAFIKLNLQVIDCAEQTVDIIGSVLPVDIVQYSSLQSVPIAAIFNSSHTTFCPITKFSVFKVVDASTKKDVTKAVSGWIYFGTSAKESDKLYFGNLVIAQSI
jgi:hypothetical protein